VTERDPFYGAELEEQVLSSMIQGRPVKSLDTHHFTDPTRALVYELLRKGTPYVDLVPGLLGKGLSELDCAYVTDLYFVDSLSHQALLEAVADLKRIALVRSLCLRVDDWRRRAPHLTYEKALKELGQAIRADGAYRSVPSSG
jgi:hypothetical protein